MPFVLLSAMALSVRVPAAGALPLLSFIVKARLPFRPVRALPCASFATSVSVETAVLSAAMVSGLAVNTDCPASGVVLLMVTPAGVSVTPLTDGVNVTVSTSVPAVTVTVYTPADFFVRADTAALFSALFFRLMSFTSMSTAWLFSSRSVRVSTCVLFPSAGSTLLTGVKVLYCLFTSGACTVTWVSLRSDRLPFLSTATPLTV